MLRRKNRSCIARKGHSRCCVAKIALASLAKDARDAASQKSLLDLSDKDRPQRFG